MRRVTHVETPAQKDQVRYSWRPRLSGGGALAGTGVYAAVESCLVCDWTSGGGGEDLDGSPECSW